MDAKERKKLKARWIHDMPTFMYTVAYYEDQQAPSDHNANKYNMAHDTHLT